MNTMWCKLCQQDMPAATSTDEGIYRCYRCGSQLSTLPIPPGVEAPSSTNRGTAETLQEEALQAAQTGSVADESAEYDGWELDEQMRHAKRILAMSRPEENISSGNDPQGIMRFDRAHNGPAAWHQDMKRQPQKPSSGTATGMLTWTALGLGTMALCCGGILLGWSVLAGRAELWSVGLPIALGGQLSLLMGLILQLDRIYNGHRDTSTRLQRFEGQLRRIEDPEGKGATSFSTSRNFRGNREPLAPLTVLDELKHQLERLETKLRSTGS